MVEVGTASESPAGSVPNAVLYKSGINAEIGVGGFAYFGKLPSEELFPANRRRLPLNHDLTPIIIDL
jgi:hypothetical protein